MNDKVAVPAGWVLVPIEPNWDMRNEGREFLIDGLEKDYEKIAYFLWKTMVNASPTAPNTRPPALVQEGNIVNSKPYWLVENQNAEWYMGESQFNFTKDSFAAVKYPTKYAAEYAINNMSVHASMGLFASEHIDINTRPPALGELSDEQWCSLFVKMDEAFTGTDDPECSALVATAAREFLGKVG